MGIFDPPGSYDEHSPFYWLRDTDARALDQAIKARREAERAAATLQATATAPAALEQRVARLETNLMALGLYARTMLTLLHDKGVISREEFSSRLHQLDMLDGTRDGR
jgi:hypothetical protein